MANKQSDNTLLFAGLVAVATFLFIKKKSTPVDGIGATKNQTVEQVTNNAWANRQTGKEKIVNDTLHYGVSAYPYAFTVELKKAGVNYIVAPGASKELSHIGYFENKRELRKFVQWLYNNDGYLATSY